jgi:hypothetical protein
MHYAANLTALSLVHVNQVQGGREGWLTSRTDVSAPSVTDMWAILDSSHPMGMDAVMV